MAPFITKHFCVLQNSKMNDNELLRITLWGFGISSFTGVCNAASESTLWKWKYTVCQRVSLLIFLQWQHLNSPSNFLCSCTTISLQPKLFFFSANFQEERRVIQVVLTSYWYMYKQLSKISKCFNRCTQLEHHPFHMLTCLWSIIISWIFEGLVFLQCPISPLCVICTSTQLFTCP